LRLRAERKSSLNYLNATSGKSVNDLVYSRTRLNFKKKIGENIQLFFQLQDARRFGEAEPNAALNNIDLLQAYAEISRIVDTNFGLKLGRQKLLFGDQRLVSPLEWSNVSRSWDACQIFYKSPAIEGNLFLSILNEDDPSALATNNSRLFSGLYLSWKKITSLIVDFYLLQMLDYRGKVQSESGNTGDLKLLSPGVRIALATQKLTSTLELVAQPGNSASDDISAIGLAITSTYQITNNLNLGFEYDFASGDSDPGDSKLETFNPLFPFGHNYQGHIDVVGWRNIHDFAIKLESFKICYIHFHKFLLADNKDAWHSPEGSVIRRANAGSPGKDIGYEIDLGAKIAINNNLSLWSGYSHFFFGEYVERTGWQKNMSWYFAALSVNF
jgi:hypothetical protein